MLKKLIPVVLGLFMTACGDKDAPAGRKDEKQQAKSFGTDRDCARMFREAQAIDSVLYTQEDVDPALANKAMVAFTDYAFYCSNDTLSPVFLVKTAQVARAVNNIPQAKLVLDRCIEDYPKFTDRPVALFMLAQLYDDPTYLNDEHQARKLYQQIIDEHPKSGIVEAAKQALEMINVSEEELMKKIKSQ